MKVAVLSTSRKANEHRRPIHPAQISCIPKEVRNQLFFEKGYGLKFGVSDEEIATLSAGIAERADLLSSSDLVILAKPIAQDAQMMKHGATLWGWLHCVQGAEITQAAIDRRLTYVTWESMNLWNEDGSFKSHIFAGNNQIAGYAAVLHATALRGTDGWYGAPKRVALINAGQVSQGALRALKSLGFMDISVIVTQPKSLIPCAFEDYKCFTIESAIAPSLSVSTSTGERIALIDLLAEADVIVNGVLQNPLAPYHFVQPGEERKLKQNALIIDISCDSGMGFPFAAATSFEQPIRKEGHIHYYAVDHTPSFLWDSATWQISNAICPYLPAAVVGGFDSDPVLKRATEIWEGKVLNKDILVFQKRECAFPHALRGQ